MIEKKSPIFRRSVIYQTGIVSQWRMHEWKYDTYSFTLFYNKQYQVSESAPAEIVTVTLYSFTFKESVRLWCHSQILLKTLALLYLRKLALFLLKTYFLYILYFGLYCIYFKLAFPYSMKSCFLYIL